MAAWLGGEFGGEWIHVLYGWVPLLFIQTITTLLIDYTPAQNLKKFLFCKKCCNWDFLGGPEAKTTAPNAEDMSLIPGQETRSCVLQLRHNAAKKINKQNKYFKSAIILIRSNKVVIQFKIKKLGGAIIYQMVKLWSYMIIKKNENNAIKCKSSKQVIILLI